MEVSAFQASAANISRVSSDGKGEEPDGRERERALVARAKEGDRDAFGALYREHVAAVSRLVRFRLGREDEDAVSEVFLRAWRGLGAYRDTGVPFAGWLYGIARHVAIDALRASIRTEPRAELPDAEVEPMTAELLTLARCDRAAADRAAPGDRTEVPGGAFQRRGCRRDGLLARRDQREAVARPEGARRRAGGEGMTLEPDPAAVLVHERLEQAVSSMRAPDVEAGWAALAAQLEAPHRAGRSAAHARSRAVRGVCRRRRAHGGRQRVRRGLARPRYDPPIPSRRPCRPSNGR